MIDGYRNFDLELFDHRAEDDGERLKVRVLSSPAGDQRQSDAAEVMIPNGLRRRLTAIGRGASESEAAIAAGRELADVLLPPPARRLFELSLATLDDDQGLRPRLRLDTFALADLPWEIVHLAHPDTPAGQEGPQGFLGLDRRLSIVRYEVLGESLPELQPLDEDEDLRCAALLSDPRGEYAPLDLDAEHEAIRQALVEVPPSQLEVRDHATVSALEDVLDEPVHIFHFAGHGAFEAEMGERPGTIEGRGFLVLEADGGGSELFPADRLAVNLRRRGVRLVVLGACESARRDAVHAWSGIAPALTQQGVPAVIGMQSPVADSNAIAFHRELYETLAAGGTVDEAVSQGRLAIFNRSDGNHRDWAAPVLYLRAEKGVLFPRPAADAPAVPSPPEPKRPIFYANLVLAALAIALVTVWALRLQDFLPPWLGLLAPVFFTALSWLGGEVLRDRLLRIANYKNATLGLVAATVLGASLNLFAVPKPFHLVRLVPSRIFALTLPKVDGETPDVTYTIELSSPAWPTSPPPIEDVRRRTLYVGAEAGALERRVAGLDENEVRARLSQLLRIKDKGLAKAEPAILEPLVEARIIGPALIETPNLPADQPLMIVVKKSNEEGPLFEIECPGFEVWKSERDCWLSKKSTEGEN